VILRLAVLIQYRSVTDRHTHRHTTTAYTVLSIASRGKNGLSSQTLKMFRFRWNIKALWMCGKVRRRAVVAIIAVFP